MKVGTVFEDSHVPMRFWLQAMYLLCSSKKGISSNQLHRTLGVTLKTAWFMSHRLREAMRVVGVVAKAKLLKPMKPSLVGGRSPKRRAGWGHKNAVLTLVERRGRARSFHVDSTTVAQIAPIVRANTPRKPR
jgi:hypothetical protein